MRLTIAAVGRLAPGPEKMLVEDYLSRANAAGKGMALSPVSLIEIDERKARGQAEQSEKLLAAVSTGSQIMALDERGKNMTSPEFAKLLGRLRDQGIAETCFLIGGADGHSQAIRDRSSLLLSLGPMVWPHMLARVMLAEQIYRAISILGNSPYHRA
ncbi:MAG: 23S rRNA (pseudouridine(1915)-N(3))-methyltransferase RlmH [Pseudomonadota bacterium]